MQLSPASLEAAYYAFSFAFQSAFEQTQPWQARIATQATSSTSSNRYPWMAQIPRLREWIGERVLNNVVARAQELKNRSFEDSIEVDRDDIEDDQFGLYAPMFAMLGNQAALWPDDLMTEVLLSTTLTAFDGQPFFHSSHPVNMDDSTKGTYQNLFASKPLSHTTYNEVRSAMMAYLGEDGKPIRVRPNLLVTGPATEKTAREILQASLIQGSSAGIQNVMNGTADLLIIPELAVSPGLWFLMDVSKPIKPFLFQLRKSPVLHSLVDPTSENVFMRKKFIYGVDSRGAAGVTLPFLAAKCTP